jgi:hypothetical protein
MKKVLMAFPAAALLALSGAALAAEEITGKIQAVDPAAKTIVLEDGSVFMAADGVALDSLQPGHEVTIAYDEQDGTKRATTVTPNQ